MLILDKVFHLVGLFNPDAVDLHTGLEGRGGLGQIQEFLAAGVATGGDKYEQDPPLRYLGIFITSRVEVHEKATRYRGAVCNLRRLSFMPKLVAVNNLLAHRGTDYDTD